MVLDGDNFTDVERAILAYLASHPAAADNAAGIQRWWLPSRFAEGPADGVEAVLAKMVAQGALSEVRLPGGSVIYSTRHPDEN